MTRFIVATLLSASMAFQLMLAAGGTTCVTSSDASAATGAQGAMAGMEMPSDDATPPPPQPCDETANPASCLTMAPCAVIGMVTADSPGIDVRRVLTRVATASAQPESRSSAPEPPPPRV